MGGTTRKDRESYETDRPAWRDWGEPAFEEAAARDIPVLLALTTSWCEFCRALDRDTFPHPSVARILDNDVVPVRVDADRQPHVRDRYIAGGWPTLSFLTPDGDVLWSGTVGSVERLVAVADQVLDAWRFRREELASEVAKRRRALDAARGRRQVSGLVRREAADDVLSSLHASFDARNGGFGEPPRFPQRQALELLYVQGSRSGDPTLIDMADRTLDGMLAGELLDRSGGGFFRYALEPDWTGARHEKLLSVNGDLIRSYALGATLRGRADWAEVARSAVDWVESELALPDGLWASSRASDPEYYALGSQERSESEPPPLDPVIYSDATGVWLQALAEAGGRLGRPEWIDRARTGLDLLLERMRAPGGRLYHFLEPGGEPVLPGLLTDLAEVALAALAVAQATGEPRYLDEALRLAASMRATLWSPDGGFLDFESDGTACGALRYEDRPLEENSAAARVLVDLALATGDRQHRALAERILALLAPVAKRYGAGASGFALVVETFFDAPRQIVVVGDPVRSEALRSTALALPWPDLRVWTLPDGGRLAHLDYPAQAEPVAYICQNGGRSGPLSDPAELRSRATASD